MSGWQRPMTPRSAMLLGLRRSHWILLVGGFGGLAVCALLIIGWMNNPHERLEPSQALEASPAVKGSCWVSAANLAKCREAAEGESARAEFQHGLILWGGQGRFPNHKAALEWFRRSAREFQLPASAKGYLLQGPPKLLRGFTCPKPAQTNGKADIRITFAVPNGATLVRMSPARQGAKRRHSESSTWNDHGRPPHVRAIADRGELLRDGRRTRCASKSAYGSARW